MTDAELPEDVREMALDRAIGEEQSSGNLAVRLALGNEHGDALLGGCERAGRRCPAADPLELRPRALGPERGADVLEDRERLLQCRSRFAPPLHAALRDAEREQAAAAVERDLDLRVPLERILVRSQRRFELARLMRRAGLGSACSCRAPTPARAAARSLRTSRAAWPPRHRAQLDERLRRSRRRTGSPPARRSAHAARTRASARDSRRPARDPERAVEVAERRGRDELDVLNSVRPRGRAASEPPAVPPRPTRAGHTRGSGERGCARRRAVVPTARPAGVPFEARAREPARSSPRSALGLAEQEQEIGSRALVADLLRSLHQLDEARPCASRGASVHSQYSASERRGWSRRRRL